MKITDSARVLIDDEARRRAQKLPAKQRLSNKEIAEQTGMAEMYIAQLVARARRNISMRVDVSHETSTHEPAKSLASEDN